MSTQEDSSGTPLSGLTGVIPEDAQAKAQELAGQVQDQAYEAAGQAQDKLRDQLDSRKSQLGEQISDQASDLRSVSDALRDQGQDRPAELADRVAGYAEQAGTYLKDKDTDTILSDAEDFGRQRPAVVAAGALALGFAASRFLKASSSRRYTSRSQPSTPSASAGIPLGTVTEANIPGVPLTPAQPEVGTGTGTVI